LAKELEFFVDMDSMGSQPPAVLLIEDDARAAAATEQALDAGSRGVVHVSHARRLRDAEHVLRDRAVRCVLLDTCRHDGGPLVAIDRIRRLAPGLAVVVLAGRRDDEMAVAALNLGAQDYLVKSELTDAQLARAVHFAIERKRCEVRLVHRALHDPLTTLPNRALFLDRIEVALDRLRRANASVTVMFLDVDDFKLINDTLGHAAGDRLLSGLATRLTTMLRPMDTIARFGGDEFIVLIEDLSHEGEAMLIAERISRAARTTIELEDHEVTVTVSLGVTMVTDPAVAPGTVIRQADSAMFAAKRRGRGRYELFDNANAGALLVAG
jgi:diguanylate cyclase (GGDEF)-like protein